MVVQDSIEYHVHECGVGGQLLVSVIDTRVQVITMEFQDVATAMDQRHRAKCPGGRESAAIDKSSCVPTLAKMKTIRPRPTGLRWTAIAG
jgi:hypothetical protein